MRKRTLLAVLAATLVSTVILGSLVAPVEEARAANFAVDSEADAPDANPGDGACATAEGECTLRAAVQESNANGAADFITVPDGDYLLDIEDAGGVQTENAAATGDLDITSEITINGADADTTTIDASGIESQETRAFDIRPNNGSATISGVTVTGGSVARGGGFLNEGTLTLVEVVVEENDADFGGAADNLGGVMTVRRSTVSSNTATFGGGIYNENGGDVRIFASTVSDNEADSDGGGVYTNTAVGEILNSTIGENSADESGGGIFSEFSALDITNATINENDAPSGSNVAVDESGGVGAANIIVANGTGENCSAPLESRGGNLDSGETCGFDEPSDDENTDPLLGILENNGGSTETYELQSGSPAIDGGINSACPGADQRGVERPRDGDGNGTFVCDVGSFEADGDLAPPPSNPPNQPNPQPNNPNACTIRGTNGNDNLRGTPRRDVICGLGGNDIIRGLGGNDIVRGGAGNDILYGGSGSDSLVGGPGRDILRGEGGRDRLNARDGVRGNDVANGGPGRDKCVADPRDAKQDCP